MAVGLWSRIVALAAVVMVVGVTFSGCRRHRPDPAPGLSLSLASVPVESDGLAVSVQDLAVRENQGRNEWSFTLVCDEPLGCRGSLRLVACYRSEGKEKKLEALREVDLPFRGEVVIGRSVPLEEVEAIERVRVEVLSRRTRDDAATSAVSRPTPRS